MNNTHKLLIVTAVVLATSLFIVYKKYIGHYPRDKKYEQKLIGFINNAADKNDSNYYFRLDSIMDFKWNKVVYVGPYLSSIEKLDSCNIDFDNLKNSALMANDHFSGLLFLNKNNNPVKFLLFDGNLPSGLEALNNQPCGTIADEAIFNLRKDANDVLKVYFK